MIIVCDNYHGDNILHSSTNLIIKKDKKYYLLCIISIQIGLIKYLLSFFTIFWLNLDSKSIVGLILHKLYNFITIALVLQNIYILVIALLLICILQVLLYIKKILITNISNSTKNQLIINLSNIMWSNTNIQKFGGISNIEYMYDTVIHSLNIWLNSLDKHSGLIFNTNIILVFALCGILFYNYPTNDNIIPYIFYGYLIVTSIIILILNTIDYYSTYLEIYNINQAVQQYQKNELMYLNLLNFLLKYMNNILSNLDVNRIEPRYGYAYSMIGDQNKVMLEIEYLNSFHGIPMYGSIISQFLSYINHIILSYILFIIISKIQIGDIPNSINAVKQAITDPMNYISQEPIKNIIVSPIIIVFLKLVWILLYNTASNIAQNNVLNYISLTSDIFEIGSISSILSEYILDLSSDIQCFLNEGVRTSSKNLQYIHYNNLSIKIPKSGIQYNSVNIITDDQQEEGEIGFLDKEKFVDAPALRKIYISQAPDSNNIRSIPSFSTIKNMLISNMNEYLSKLKCQENITVTTKQLHQPNVDNSFIHYNGKESFITFYSSIYYSHHGLLPVPCILYDYKGEDELSIPIICARFAGPSGSGKSSVLQLFSEIKRSKDIIDYTFTPPFNMNYDSIIESIIGYTITSYPQNAALNLDITYYKILTCFADILGINLTVDNMIFILNLVDLKKDLKESIISASDGEKQKLILSYVLMKAIIQSCKSLKTIITLDEFVSNLDIKGRNIVSNLLLNVVPHFHYYISECPEIFIFYISHNGDELTPLTQLQLLFDKDQCSISLVNNISNEYYNQYILGKLTRMTRNMNIYAQEYDKCVTGYNKEINLFESYFDFKSQPITQKVF